MIHKNDFFYRETDPLVNAIWKGDVGTVRLMVKKSECNLLTANRFGWIPLHEAAYYGQDQCIKILLRGKVFTVI